MYFIPHKSVKNQKTPDEKDLVSHHRVFVFASDHKRSLIFFAVAAFAAAVCFFVFAAAIAAFIFAAITAVVFTAVAIVVVTAAAVVAVAGVAVRASAAERAGEAVFLDILVSCISNGGNGGSRTDDTDDNGNDLADTLFLFGLYFNEFILTHNITSMSDIQILYIIITY